MSFEAMTWAVNQKCKNSSQKLVLLMLANHSNGHTGQCNPSHSLLAKECCMSVSSLKTQIKVLANNGYLSVVNKSIGKVRTSNQYVLNLSYKPIESEGQNLASGHFTSGGGSNSAYAKTKGCNDSDSYKPIESDSQILTGVGQNLTGGGSESGYKPVIETNNSLSLKTDAQKQCFDWAKSHPFWGDAVTDISKFIYLYNKNSPKGLRSQFEADMNKGKAQQIKNQTNNHKRTKQSIANTDYSAGLDGFNTN